MSPSAILLRHYASEGFGHVSTRSHRPHNRRYPFFWTLFGLRRMQRLPEGILEAGSELQLLEVRSQT
jgi:hypothetical protein